VSVNSIDEQAPVISRRSIVIAAPIGTLWRLHTDVNAWPNWQKAIDRSHLEDDFRPGATFTWETYNLTISSRTGWITQGLARSSPRRRGVGLLTLHRTPGITARSTPARPGSA
jgi:hypothetical protein